jgi:hypothetical protein
MQLTHVSRGNGGGLRSRVGLRFRAVAGATGPRFGTADLEGGAAMTQHVEGLVSDRPPDILSMPRAAT